MIPRRLQIGATLKGHSTPDVTTGEFGILRLAFDSSGSRLTSVASQSDPAVITWDIGSGAQLAGGAAARQLHLHARSLEIPHPQGGTLSVTAPLPAHMRRMWEFFGFDANVPDPFAELELPA